MALTKTKAKLMLKEGTARGQALSKKQKGLFGLIAGGGTPRKQALRMRLKKNA